ncbi:MAG: AmmeMemoRadiSam system protein A [Rhodocyclaceae bacterium]
MPIDHASLDSPALGRALIGHARDAIAQALGLPRTMPPEYALLDGPGATFVTLTRHGVLRGCIGQLQASRTLRDDVRANAVAAALRDPRFAPLTRAEWPTIAVEVSVLGPIRYTPCPDEARALTLIEPGADGVVLSGNGRGATFLPQVWRQLPTAREFLAHLLRKAGLSQWPADMQVGLYRVHEFHEPQASEA